MLFIDRTYSETTPESAEDGETSDSGFIIQAEPVTFPELVDILKSHTEPSSYPCSATRYDWFSTGYEIEDYGTMTARETCVHFSRKNPDRKEKYWRLAAKCAGIRVKE